MNAIARRRTGGRVALVLMALVLTACTTSAGGTSGAVGADGGRKWTGKTLNVLVGANTNRPDEFKAWQTRISDAFKAHTGADLAFETFASATEELTKIQTAVVSGQGPDVYAVGTTFTPTAHSTGAFVKLDAQEWDKVGGRDRFVPAALGISGPSPADEVGIPFTSRPFVLAYNTELFKQAGLDKPADSWDGLLAQAKQLTRGNVWGFATGYADNYAPWKFAWTLAYQAGNPLVEGSKARLDDPTVQRAYRVYFDWLAKDKVVNPAAVGWNDTQAAAEFAAGNAAMMLMTTASSRVTFDASTVKGKYAYALMPTIPPGFASQPPQGVPVTSIISGDNLVIAKYSSVQDLAAEYVKLITSEDHQLYYSEHFGDLPANAAAAKKVIQSDPSLAPILDSAAAARTTPFTGAWGDIQLALTNIVVQARPDLAAGGVSDAYIAEALGKAQKEAQSALDRAAAGG